LIFRDYLEIKLIKSPLLKFNNGLLYSTSPRYPVLLGLSYPWTLTVIATPSFLSLRLISGLLHINSKECSIISAPIDNAVSSRYLNKFSMTILVSR
jgi:hypothetical protein